MKCTSCGSEELEAHVWTSQQKPNILEASKNVLMDMPAPTKPYVCKKCGHLEIFKQETMIP